MICNSCGRSAANDNANFCDYCGASLKEGSSRVQSSEINQNRVMEERKVEEDKPISFLNWIGTMLLPFIPLVGPIVYLVMLLVWSFGSDSNPSKKNWARANLVVMIISFLILIVFFTSTIMSLLNNGMDLNSYLNDYNQFY